MGTRFTPYPFQQVAIDDALRWFATAQPGDRRLYAAPTGAGKSVIELVLRDHLPCAWIVTPRVEIIRGMLDKLGVQVNGLSEAALLDQARTLRITTPIRLRNLMLKGEFAGRIDQLIFDEGHHHQASSWQDLDLLAGKVPAVAFTATPYRGTAKSTVAFRAEWGEPVWIITYPEAVQLGVISFPTCKVVPLVDDDLIEVVNGEFEVKGVEAATRSRLAEAARLCAGWVTNTGRLDRPTMASLPTTETALAFSRELGALGVPNNVVTADTPGPARQEAFDNCTKCRSLLVQIAVVSEGVDLPIRRLLDLSPSISPVRWLQQFGRITRPVPAGEAPPEYVGTNRNLLRHAYLLEGCLPPSVYSENLNKFGNNTYGRAGIRVLGLEALGKLKPANLSLSNGLPVTLYSFAAVESGQVRQYCVLVHPLREECLWATRVNSVKEDGTRDYGRWQRTSPPSELTGFSSLPPSPLTDKQKAWWSRCAARHGLDPDTSKVNRKNFCALPVLSDTRSRI